MSELIAKVAKILGITATLVQRSAEARAEASGNTVEEGLQSWAGGEAVAAAAPAEQAPVAEETPVEGVKGEVVKAENVEKVVEEENVELKRESALVCISGVVGVAIFAKLLEFGIRKTHRIDLVNDTIKKEIVERQG